MSGCDWVGRYMLDRWEVMVPALAVVFLYGICLGSFLNVCIWRMPRGESVIDAPSHCTKCGARIRWYDNLPVISYLVLRGRCRSCSAPYSPRYLLVELITGILFVLTALRVGWSGQPAAMLAPDLALVMLAVATAWIDAEHRIIPDALTRPAMVAALFFAAVLPVTQGMAEWWCALAVCVLSGMFPAAFLAGFAWLGRRLARREVLGWGDVKFMAASGMLIGLEGAFFTMVAGSLLAVVWGLGVKWCRGGRLRGMEVAFGPFLAAGALLWLFCGAEASAGFQELLAGLLR